MAWGAKPPWNRELYQREDVSFGVVAQSISKGGEVKMAEGCWTRITVTVSPEATEAVAGILMDSGVSGIEIQDPRIWEEVSGVNQYGELYPPPKPIPHNTPVKVIAYLAGDCRGARVIDTIRERVMSLKQIGLDPSPALVTTMLLDESNWAQSWKEFYHTQRVGQRVVVKPTWETYVESPGDVVLELDPGMAFGTGEHETTRLCLMQLERWIQPGCLVYDIGTGSGILALAAAKLGAAQVVACDLDPVAVAVARGNVADNGLEDRVFVQVGSVNSITGQADIIVANIITDVILEILSAVTVRLVEGGCFIAGGIIGERRDEVMHALSAAGFSVMQEIVDDDWVCLVSKK